MLIHVVYHDNRYDYVKASRLDEYLDAGLIAMFQRSSGWVRVGIDPIRKKKTQSYYTGVERRQPQGGIVAAL